MQNFGYTDNPQEGKKQVNEHHHHHGRHEHPHRDQDIEIAVDFEDKLMKLIDHWVKHNEDHVKNYREWARRAEENHFEAVSGLLERVAEKTSEISTLFLEAKTQITKGRV
jgi:hypothetical protein